MSRMDQEIKREIRRIEGQLLVAKQICRENLKEINSLKKQQENDAILQQTNQLLSMKSLHSNEHADQFNKLLRLVNEQRTNTLDNTIQHQDEDKQTDQSDSLLVDLSLNIAELESLFDYAKTLITQPITSINALNHTVSLQEIADDLANDRTKEQDSISIKDLQKRIETMHQRLANFDQCDDCVVQ